MTSREPARAGPAHGRRVGAGQSQARERSQVESGGRRTLRFDGINKLSCFGAGRLGRTSFGGVGFLSSWLSEGGGARPWAAAVDLAPIEDGPAVGAFGGGRRPPAATLDDEGRLGAPPPSFRRSEGGGGAGAVLLALPGGGAAGRGGGFCLGSGVGGGPVGGGEGDGAPRFGYGSSSPSIIIRRRSSLGSPEEGRPPSRRGALAGALGPAAAPEASARLAGTSAAGPEGTGRPMYEFRVTTASRLAESAGYELAILGGALKT